MTQDELAKKCGVSQQFISMWLNGFRKPSWGKCKVFAEVLSTDVETIMEADRRDLQQLINRAE